MRSDRCGNCHFYDGSVTPAICRRFPPLGITGWATVYATNWCGEWRPNEEERQRQIESMKGDY